MASIYTHSLQNDSAQVGEMSIRVSESGTYLSLSVDVQHDMSSIAI